MEHWLSLREREGLTYRELSERSGIPSNTLAGWAWRSKRRALRDGGSKFVELAIAPESHRSDEQLELVLRGARRLRFAASVDADVIARLAAALERC